MSDREQSPSVAGLLEQLNRWCLDRMTALNQDILDHRAPGTRLAEELRDVVLTRLPAIEDLTAIQACRLLVLLGLAGASLARHFQEADAAHRSTPERAFAGLAAGPHDEPFLGYVARLAERTGTGHPARDSYASLVRWNLPTAQVRWAGRQLATLPGVFNDQEIRTYTGTGDEKRFFELLKGSEVLERAVNQELMPLSDGLLDPDDPQALHRIGRAVLLLDALRLLNHDFAERPPQQSLAVGYFLDVFRQYAVHWSAGDVPPSGALDAEALVRDLLVGIVLPEYPQRLQRVFPGLLDDERATLTRLIERPSLPEAVLRRAGIEPADLAGIPPARLHDLVARTPALAALYLLLNAHARVAGVHLRLSKQFLFTPQRARDRDGIGDTGVVSNRIGTTGMDESWLELLTRVRHHHLLIPLHAVPARTLEALAGLDRVRDELTGTDGVQVEFETRPAGPTRVA